MRVLGAKRSVVGVDANSIHLDKLYDWQNIDDMLAEADYLCLACPHTPDTEGLMNEVRFSKMKPESVLINIGRGALIDSSALIKALQSGSIQGAVLDVASPEPLPEDSLLWDMDNVILFPHSASTSVHENERLVTLFLNNMTRYLSKKPLLNTFDAVRLY
jgi:glyoxylate/hydroxypyruvate reductase